MYRTTTETECRFTENTYAEGTTVEVRSGLVHDGVALVRFPGGEETYCAAWRLKDPPARGVCAPARLELGGPSFGLADAPCRGCGESFPTDPDSDYCPICAASNAGDVVALCKIAGDGGPFAARAAVELYDGFGINEQDRVGILAASGRF